MLAHFLDRAAGYAWWDLSRLSGYREDRSALVRGGLHLLTYAVMNMGAFAVVTLIARRGDQQNNVDDYNGLASPHRSRHFAVAVSPQFAGNAFDAGFMGRSSSSATLRQGYVWLIVIVVPGTQPFPRITTCGS